MSFNVIASPAVSETVIVVLVVVFKVIGPAKVEPRFHVLPLTGVTSSSS
jgi:hypothetical protein